MSVVRRLLFTIMTQVMFVGTEHCHTIFREQVTGWQHGRIAEVILWHMHISGAVIARSCSLPLSMYVQFNSYAVKVV